MQIYKIFMSELHATVKFKVLTVPECEDFLEKIQDLEKEEKKKRILQHMVFNLNTDVSASLNMMSRTAAYRALDAIYSGIVMLNPSIDLDYWLTIAYMTAPNVEDIYDEDLEDDDEGENKDQKNLQNIKDLINKKIAKRVDPKPKVKKITKQKFLGLEFYLKKHIIGQDEAIEEVVSTLTRSQAGLSDENRPLGVFLFAGASGVGKTELARCLNTYLNGNDSHLVRIDCGEYQHKHENQKLLGSPPGYVGHDEGGHFINQVKKSPNSIILIDEVEKAHPDIWNTFLTMFDEGKLTDNKGEVISFSNNVIIMTTNLGNDKTVEHMLDGGAGFTGNIDFSRRKANLPKRDIVTKNTIQAIDKYFKPEFVNRIDKVIVFNHLTRQDCEKIAEIEMNHVAEKLAKKGMAINYSQNVIDKLIDLGIDSIKGARGISQVRRDKIETNLAKEIVYNTIPKGTMFYIDYLEDGFIFNLEKPKIKNVKE